MNQLQGKLYLFCAFSLAGTSVIAASFVTGKLGTFTITAVSLFFALLLLIPLCAKDLIPALRALSLGGFLLLLLQALCGIFLFRVFLLSGLRRTSAGEAGILTGATPALTALLAAIVLKEPVSHKKLAGILSTAAGIVVIQGILVPGNGLTAEHMAGNLLVLCASASESAFNTFSRISAVKEAGSAKPLSPLVQTAVVSFLALLLCLVPALFECPLKRLTEMGLAPWLALIWYGVFVTALAFISWYAGIRRCSAFTAAAFSGMMPFTSLLLSAAVLHERAGWPQWLGGGLVILGMLLVGAEANSKNQIERRKRHAIH